MAVPVTYQSQAIDKSDVRFGKHAYVGAIDINVFSPAAKDWAKVAGVFCVVRSVTGLTISPITETTIMGIGKKVTEITQGEQWEGYSLEVYGNAKGIYRWLANTAPTSLSVAHEYQYPDRPLFLFEHVYEPDTNTISASRLIPYAIARQGEFAGLEPDGETFTTLEFYNRDSTEYPVRTLKEGYMWVAECWYQNGVVINATAPDGVAGVGITTFTLGTGNGSFSAAPAPPPDAVLIDASLSGAAQYVYVFVNGVDVTDQVTFNPATEVVDFGVGNAPDNQSKLVVIYGIAQSGDVPLVEGGINPTDEEELFYSWEDAGLA